MKIAVLKERRPFERRVAATPETVKKFIGLGASVTVETGAGDGAFFLDDAYAAAGATVATDAATALAGADLVLKVRRPLAPGEGEVDELALLKPGQTVLGLLDPYGGQAEALAATGVSAVAMEFVPRITRAQVMDVLSSQANLAGYKAVIEAASVYAHGFPMMMTAAGTVPPAKVLVMGAGVAGLQAIATARRLGGVVSATDVRPATKEQVESLGATFVAVIDEEFQQAQTAGGYAKEMSAAYKEKQAALIAETIKKQDIVICTALIPGRKAPTLVTAEMVASMKPGSVIVDLAVEQGGNCDLSEYAQTVVKHSVSIIGHANMPSLIATDASALYARNLLAYVTPLIDKETKALVLNEEDEIVKASLIAKGGALVHPSLVKPAA
ncbi:Re/Si-specific NAD(P)(+) transhydrogenase subunit alpha [Elstera cyanobacteriorum]|uniref:Re/Si-specific NAD(P)(+) transhydrogenase subunit alpha n=1 Tax=Elstera cyanobacteriorum TaxID=2022747 RepID=UPI00235457CE|nr:Re/Si-specific NAD(P)(+) transhydrogenase subunit alpha [Elstera cyanobacteriorum]MCK6441253.1 Re/Si-specific NAD(P)(+) transhydrogenase subunit alpha [Elstera cyanobacteriorum]